jgi:hypothetical protein
MFFRLIFLHLVLFSTVFCCPDESVAWNNYCYVFDLTESEFGKAEMIYQKNGGHLASIHDAFTNVIIGQNAPDYFHQLPDFWIGANSLTTKNVWEWTDGSNFDFNDWRKGEPKNTSDSMCASMSTNDGYWNAKSCFTYKPFVCGILNTDTVTTTMKTTGKTLSSTTSKTTTTSVKTTPTISSTITKKTTLTTRTTPTVTNATPSPPPLPVLQNCSSGWTYFAPTNSFYCVNSSSYLPWPEAEKYCKSIGGHLASVHSDLENRLIWANSLNIGCTFDGPWIGLYTVDNGKTYQWTDNSKFGYQKWWTGFPNINNGTCVIMDGYCGSDIGSFHNWNCSAYWGIICKKAFKHIKFKKF